VVVLETRTIVLFGHDVMLLNGACGVAVNGQVQTRPAPFTTRDDSASTYTYLKRQLLVRGCCMSVFEVANMCFVDL
jgi:hypothetical protein